MNTIRIFFLAALLSGCVSLSDPPSNVTVSDKGYSFSFDIPKGWRIYDEKKDYCQLKPVGHWQPVTISIGFATRYKRDPNAGEYSQQFNLIDQYLKYWRSINFKNMGYTTDGHHVTPDGRERWLFLEVSNESHLITFIPESDFIVQATLYGGTDDISKYRQDFYAILDSYHPTNQAQQGAAANP